MKVKVISSRHSHITLDMVGEAECSPDEFLLAFSKQEIPVRFKNVPVPVPTINAKKDTTVMMLRKELVAYV